MATVFAEDRMEGNSKTECVYNFVALALKC